MAILSTREEKMMLSDIYEWILYTFPYFRNRGPGWRNSIRHNLSLNACFIKAGPGPNSNRGPIVDYQALITNLSQNSGICVHASLIGGYLRMQRYQST